MDNFWTEHFHQELICVCVCGGGEIELFIYLKMCYLFGCLMNERNFIYKFG